MFGGNFEANRLAMIKAKGMDIGKPFNLPGTDDDPFLKLYGHDGTYPGMTAVFDKDDKYTMDFLSALPKEYFQKHGITVSAVRDKDTKLFTGMSKSRLEEAVGLNLFDKLGDIQ